MDVATQPRPSAGGLEEQRPRAAREALTVHLNARQDFEAGEDGEDDPRYTPGDCVIA